MLVYVLNQDGKPLMPCVPVIARLLLKEKKARVLHKTPFTIKMLIETTDHTQEVVAGMDTGSKTLGCAAVANGKIVYASEVTLRNDVFRKMKRRATYRRTRRGRKTRYRPARWNNRASMRKEGRLAPSIRSKLESHLREKRFVELILPVTKWIVETAQFDIHKITNPEVAGKSYQEGPQKDFLNTKAYVLHRDGYKCKSGRKEHSPILCVHHIIWCKDGGTDAPANLITLCRNCHDALHAGEWELPRRRRSKTRHATHIGIVQERLKKSGWKFVETFGYLTKFKREQFQLLKSHVNDAIVICCEEGGVVDVPMVVFYKRHVSAGDYQQTKGRRSERRIPTGKLFGLRKFDLVKTSKGIGFVKGKRSTGKFAIADVQMNLLFEVNVRKNCERLSARSTTLIKQRRGASSST